MALEANDETKKQVSALIVDDDRVIRKIHSMILRSLKVKSEMAVNGKEAVDLFRSGANFDIVFMDLEMPIMNGIEATKELRAMGVTCKIVGVTSRDKEVKEAFLEAGLDFCHLKPLTVAKVTSLLEQL
ncbi:hypothetical protein LWI29_024413 [Acer saccharum]|uniref:Response regulatory domain-containing protein n=1 Tax=Acer saccharum TaxID=4024 RepID=A0AA39T7C5_ACESA|nr:hypothetical protein LWI29_024413 [Acer saccharum]KAK1581749.1 hypothetical protein Q3G72_008704 [Acer saccharum]